MSRLAENVAHFARGLRAAGLPVGPARVVEAVAALETALPRSRADFYWTLHALFVTRRAESLIFAQAFALFWRRRGLIEKLIAQMSPVVPGGEPEARKPQAGALRVAEAFLPASDRAPPMPPRAVELSSRFTASEIEALARKDFAQMSAEEMAEARRLIGRIVLPLDRLTTRRLRPASTGARIDPRRTVRLMLRQGGEAVRLARAARAEWLTPVVALVDISGSMAEYSRLFLHFLHALGRTRPVTVFLFATRLTNITRDLREKDPDEALARAARHAPDWEGGTRIAEALNRFNRDWARRLLTGGPIVLLVSDGLERSDAARLGEEAGRLARSCRRLVWLNPLLRYDGFAAKAGGIRALLTAVDEFRPVHSLASLRDLAAALAPHGTYRAGMASDPRYWLREVAG